ncbi:unnamed protein product [Caenorhabditis auriculariae]|uniref:G-protein coupled receptors family 1 profile domain-containing protein n=1 Tax=Caenorhabditis auriculariae TaxID=2777116 RepID=A0A8S1H1T4_9PELO|nr:unnamed protein product [Caenorhabditis auriculariae]
MDENYSEPVCIDTSIFTQNAVELYFQSFEYFLLVSCFLSTALQIYVLATSVSYIRRATGDECLHIFLLSMTLGDLLLTSFCYPIEQLRQQEIITPPRWINVTQQFLTWLGLSASSVSLILLNVDKLLYFKSPLRYTSIVTVSRGVYIVLCVWTGCAVFVSLCWYLECFTCEDDCTHIAILSNKVVMYIVFTFSACIAPSLTSLVVAVYILNVVSSHRSTLAKGMRSPEIFILRTHYANHVPSLDSLSTCFTLFFSWTFSYLISLNAILNPIITVTVLPQYRFVWLCRLFGCTDRPSATYV